MAAGNVLSVDLAVIQTDIKTRRSLTRPPRKSITIPVGGSLTTLSAAVTNVDSVVINNILCFLLIEADADLNVSVSDGGTPQTITTRGLFLHFGAIDSVEIAATSATPVEVRIHHS